MSHCSCTHGHDPRRVVLTGGPGAGKTAVLEVLRRATCEHVVVLPEAAGLIFRGGFPRGSSVAARRCTQRAIFYVQHELEATALEANAAIVTCDRGTIDGFAYWPGPDDMWESLGTTLADELARYHAVIHLRTPPVGAGYNHDNPLRTESAEEAAAIDARIAIAWSRHPRRFEIPATIDFFEKVRRAVDLVLAELPACCRHATRESWTERALRA
jgi:predicted ATPase